MDEHPRARLARLFGLALAYDRDEGRRPEFLKPGMEPSKAGRWTVYSFSTDAAPVLSPYLFDGPEESDAGYGVPPLYR